MRANMALCLAFAAAASVFGQPMATTTLGGPLATVKLTKVKIIYDKAFKEDVQKMEAAKGSALSADERMSYLNDVINDVLFYQMCERDGVKVSPGEIDSYIAKMRAQRPAGETEQQYAAFLASQGIPYEELRDYYEKQVLIQRWLIAARSAEMAKIPPVTIDEILSTYDMYKARLVRPDTVKISFLLVPFKDATAAERAKAADQAKSLSQKLAKGESFDVLRLRSKEEGYAASAEPVYFERSEVFLKQFGKAFYDTAFSLKDGAVSAPFETEAGWWIVRRMEYLPQKLLELSDPYRLGKTGSVQDYIGQLLAKEREGQFLKKTFDDLFVKLRSQAEIKIIGKP